jgi:RNA polymerase sigma-70 factor (ECF subfamily)
VEGQVEASELCRLVDKWLGMCSPEKRKVFVRRYWYMDPVADICKRFGISRSKADTMLHRMREELRTFLEKEGYGI